MLARDYLCVMGSSCAVERTFSSAADVCTSDRGGLTARTIERAVAVCQWLKQGMIPAGKVSEAISVAEKLLGKVSKFARRAAKSKKGKGKA